MTIFTLPIVEYISRPKLGFAALMSIFLLLVPPTATAAPDAIIACSQEQRNRVFDMLREECGSAGGRALVWCSSTSSILIQEFECNPA